MGVLVALFVGAIIFSNNKSTDSPTTNTTASASSHTKGKGSKGVILLEYGDFQCPACGQYYPLVKQVKEKYGDDITFQFRNFPLVQIHQNAMVASRAAEAAGLQGKFWEMHDILYERQQSWESSSNAPAIMEDYAAELGLNVDKFKTDFASSAVNDTIQADMQAGQQAGVNSTPSFYINGTKVDPLPQDLAGFSKLIDDAIANK